MRKKKMPNFEKLMQQLKAIGVGQTEVAEHTGRAQPSIGAIAKGEVTDPKYSIGQGIIQLHDYHCKGERK